jgi:hypothetical protein
LCNLFLFSAGFYQKTIPILSQKYYVRDHVPTVHPKGGKMFQRLIVQNLSPEACSIQDKHKEEYKGVIRHVILKIVITIYR